MPTIKDQEAMGASNVVVAHVFGGPIVSADSSQAVTTSASEVALTTNKVYRFVSDVNCYFYFGPDDGDDATADIASLLIAEVPEVFRVPKGMTKVFFLGTASGTVWVNEMGV